MAWLLGIARNCVSDAMAKRETPVAEVPEVAARGDRAKDEAVQQRLTLGRAGDARRARPGAARAPLRRRSHRAADRGRLELQMNAVEVALHRALARLREILESEGFGEAAAELLASL